MGAGFPEKFSRLRGMKTNAGSFEDFQASLMQYLDLVVGQPAKTRRPVPPEMIMGFWSLDHYGVLPTPFNGLERGGEYYCYFWK